MKNTKALIADKSALVRRFMKNVLEKLGFEVDSAKDAKELFKKVYDRKYDIVIVDIALFQINDLIPFQEMMQKRPTRLFVTAIQDEANEDLALKAMEMGAIGYIQKPDAMLLSNKEEFTATLIQKIQEAMKISPLALKIRKRITLREEKRHNLVRDDKHYVLIGASTGGPKLVEAIARALPCDYPFPICVVQHMPINFTGKFAQRLDSISKIHVVEASQGEELRPGKMIIGKGGKHLHFRRDQDKVLCKLVPNSMKRFFVPSVDEMYFSALETMNPKNILAVLLTGIGDDGADGMVALKKAGAYTIAESEESATVYGMPKEAFVRGGVIKVLDFDKILEEIIAYGSKYGIETKI